MPSKDVQIYCESCRTSDWMRLDLDSIQSDSGLIRRAILHSGHTLNIEIDKNGSVRKNEVVQIEQNPLTVLIEDVAQGMHYLNTDTEQAIVINAYTSNNQLKKFFQSIIVEMFKQSTTRTMEDTFIFEVSSFEGHTVLDTDGLHLSVGPYIRANFTRLSDPFKGIILDIKEAEENQLDIQSTISGYDWVAIIVPKDKKEGYHHAFSSLFEETATPFFIDALGNSMIRDLFDFIFAITLQAEN